MFSNTALQVDAVITRVPSPRRSSVPCPRSTGTVLISADGRYLRVDPAFAAIIGHPVGQLLGRSLAAVSHPDDVAADLNGIAALFARRSVRHDLDKRYITQEGQVVWAETSATLVAASDGVPEHVLRLVREITERPGPDDLLLEADRRLREFQVMGGVGSWEIDLASDRISRSESLLGILGMSTEDDHQPYADVRSQVVHPDDQDRVRDVMRALLVEGAPMRMRYRITRPVDGVERWIEARGERFSRHGVPVRASGTMVDVTETVLAETVRDSQTSALRIAGHQEALLSTLVQGVIVIRADGVITTINDAAAAVGGVSADQLKGMVGVGAWWGAVDEHGVPIALGDLPASRALRDGTTVRRTVGISRADGTLSWQDVTAVPILDENGRPESVVVGLSDVTDARRAEQALSVSEERFRLAFDNAPVGMAMVDLSASVPGRLRRVNAALCRFTGRSPRDLESASLLDISHPDEEAGWRESVAALRSGKGATKSRARRFTRADGTIVHGQVSLSYMPSADAEVPFAICLIEDITARKQAEAALLHQSMHDALTGLCNRNPFYEQVGHALAAARRSHRSVGNLFIDLDGYKAVNDNSGHAAGDELLVQVADRLRTAARSGDTVARLGGDEFAVICIDMPDLPALIKVGEQVLTLLNTEFRLSGATHRISGSIGVHLSDGSTDPDQLLAAADAAMYRAKAAGRNRLGVVSR
jgi:diguanylate cyclase (GGDEF)-like protein/PAS domain S-box-containing protein